MTLITPTGKPIGATPISGEQLVGVFHMMVDAQVARLLQVGVPPLVVVNAVVDLLTNLVAGLEPASERGTLVQNVVKKIQEDVAKKAGQRMLSQPMKMRL